MPPWWRPAWAAAWCWRTVSRPNRWWIWCGKHKGLRMKDEGGSMKRHHYSPALAGVGFCHVRTPRTKTPLLLARALGSRGQETQSPLERSGMGEGPGDEEFFTRSKNLTL